MYAITGISGQVGGAVARALLAQGLPVRAVLRDAGKAPAWRARGCEVALAAMDDAVALARAFAGAEAVFVLLPPDFDPAPGFPAARAVIAALAAALRQAEPRRVVCLSTVGAQASQENLLSQLQEMERVLGQLPMPIAFLRAAWFMENAAWDLAGAREHGLVPSLLQPTSRAIPMVATADVGALAAQLLRQPWQGRKVVELEGPARVSPDELAAVLGRLLARRVVAQAVPREDWEARLRAQGSRHPLPRMRMLDGFNQGWITFEHATIKGQTALEQVLRGLLEGAP